MKTILIVDDEVFIRQIYRRIFMSCGNSLFRVLESSNIFEAFEHVFREEVDLILLDIRMPQGSGDHLYAAIRRYNPKIKIVVCSVNSIDQQKKIIPQADGYFDKSEGALSLLEKIANSFTYQGS